MQQQQTLQKCIIQQRSHCRTCGDMQHTHHHATFAILNGIIKRSDRLNPWHTHALAAFAYEKVHCRKNVARIIAWPSGCVCLSARYCAYAVICASAKKTKKKTNNNDKQAAEKSGKVERRAQKIRKSNCMQVSSASCSTPLRPLALQRVIGSFGHHSYAPCDSSRVARGSFAALMLLNAHKWLQCASQCMQINP